MGDILRKSKCDCLLEGLSFKEITKFEKFLKSKLGDGGVNIYKFWAFKLCQLRSSNPKNQDSCSGEFSRKTISDFVKILESFISQRGFESDVLSQKIYLSRELRTRDVDKYFSVMLEDVKTFHNHKSLKGFRNMLNITLLQVEEYYMYNAHNEELKMFETSRRISKLSEDIIIYSKLFEYVNKRLYAMDSLPYDDELMNTAEIANFVKLNIKHYKISHPNIYMLYLFFEMLEDAKNDKKVKDALTFLNNNENNFLIDFLQFSYETILRFLIYKVNSGSTNSYKITYDVIKEIDGKGILNKINHIQPLNFLAILSVSLAFGDSDYANRLIVFHKDKINKEFRNQVISISKGMIEFSKGNYKDAKNIIGKEKPQNLSLYLFAKSTLLKSIYELRELRSILPFIDAMKHYLNRNPGLIQPYKESVFKFLNYVNLLSTVKRKGKEKISELYAKINEEPSFFQRKWVLEKAEEMISQK